MTEAQENQFCLEYYLAENIIEMEGEGLKQRLLEEEEWRSLNLLMGAGWNHFMVY